MGKFNVVVQKVHVRSKLLQSTDVTTQNAQKKKSNLIHQWKIHDDDGGGGDVDDDGGDDVDEDVDDDVDDGQSWFYRQLTHTR